MPRKTFPLELRRTRRYRTGWAYLDDWAPLGTYSVLRSKSSRIPDGWGEYTLVDKITVRVDGKASRAQVEQALRDGFALGCACEHDCCGHLYGGADRVRRIKGREWLVEASYRPNI